MRPNRSASARADGRTVMQPRHLDEAVVLRHGGERQRARQPAEHTAHRVHHQTTAQPWRRTDVKVIVTPPCMFCIENH
jgi:hypothetical protein